jgi:thiamine biosynthesis lipoprotein
MHDYHITKLACYYRVSFSAMASPCEILLHTDNKELVSEIAKAAFIETSRIEDAFSRYKVNNLCWKLNQSNGQPVSINQETFKLLNYASQLFLLSNNLFDITSGVLRKVWQFTNDSKPPSQSQIDQVLPFVGFEKINYNQHEFSMPTGMEVDFGGIGKEYCVDTVASLVDIYCQKNEVSFLVNFGGDLVAKNYNIAHPAWKVGLESVQAKNESQAVIEVLRGAIATSGSTKRVFEYQGKQYAHILNPITGYPVEGAPRSVSVFAKTCSLAGGMSTLAQLQGKDAEKFLSDNKVKNICCW